MFRICLMMIIYLFLNYFFGRMIYANMAELEKKTSATKKSLNLERIKFIQNVACMAGWEDNKKLIEFLTTHRGALYGIKLKGGSRVDWTIRKDPEGKGNDLGHEMYGMLRDALDSSTNYELDAKLDELIYLDKLFVDSKFYKEFHESDVEIDWKKCNRTVADYSRALHHNRRMRCAKIREILADIPSPRELKDAESKLCKSLELSESLAYVIHYKQPREGGVLIKEITMTFTVDGLIELAQHHTNISRRFIKDLVYEKLICLGYRHC